MNPKEAEITWNTPAPADQRTFTPELVFEAGLRHHHLANTAYPIHHQTTMRPYRVPRKAVESTTVAAWQDIDRLGLYVHVPFCVARCRYCEYTVVGHSDSEAEDAYFNTLLHEFSLYRERLDTPRKTVIGFDIGGGTPSIAKVSNIRRVVEAARATFRFQPGMSISIETTPIIAEREPEKIHAFKEMGIDRVGNIRNAGFCRLNVDLMYGFADQSPETWRTTVEETVGLGPEYITLYQMRYKGTRIQGQAARVSRRMVNELEEIARDSLLAAGYVGTPGKNTYSKLPGDVGTSDYLTERVVRGTPYLGLGLGAQSLSHHTLSYNLGAAAKVLKPYLWAVHAGRLPIQDIYHLPMDVAMAKMIAVSFYFGQIHGQHFYAKFGVRLEDHFPREVAFLLQHRLMEHVGPYLRLTVKGAQHFNGVVALFYTGAVKDYLIHLESSFAAPQQATRGKVA
jgi:oxygen-independent coproporphyrinogen-3 oxidase